MCSTVKARGNRLIANNEVRPHSLNGTARLRVGIAAQELIIKRAISHFRESRAEAEVLAGAEPDMRRLGTSDVSCLDC